VSLVSYFEKNKDVTVNSADFLSLVNNSLSDVTVTSNQRMAPILKVWDEVNRYTYSRENRLIQNLQESNRGKFSVITSVIENEILKNQELQRNLDSYFSPIENEYIEIV
jgi:hypothetical protein